MLVAIVILGLSAASCRLDPVAPRSAALVGSARAPIGAPLPGSPAPDAGNRRPHDYTSQVPIIVRFRSEVRDGTLIVSGRLRPRDPLVETFYSPDREGGWALQLFLDTQTGGGGYWLGYDYIVRGVEWSPEAGTFVIRRIEPDDSTPGGWGPESGLATFELDGARFEIRVPLDQVGGFSGQLGLAIETYATMNCEECDSGTTAWYVEDYFGSVGVRGPAALLGRDSRGSLALRGAPRSADLDPSLVLWSAP